MLDGRCPKCDKLFSPSQSDFGKEFKCASCGFNDILDTGHLARFKLPEKIVIKLTNKDNSPAQLVKVVVIVDYGYQLPPLTTDEEGVLIISNDMFEKARLDEISTGLMDHKGDYALNRFVKILLLTPGQLTNLGRKRKASNWSILSFEKELYGDMNNLISIYNNNNNSKITPKKHIIDLDEDRKIYEIMINIDSILTRPKVKEQFK